MAAMLLPAPGAEAGFGISPPFVKTKKPIFPGSHFEQIITLLRSDTEDDLVARIKLEAPEIAGWITVAEGYEFELPPNQLQIPMHVAVDVPKDAEIGRYLGYLNIQIVPKNRSLEGGVAIALGARVDIELEITDEPFVDFSIRDIKIPDVRKFNRPWSWRLFSYFFYRLKLVMRIENTGNIPVAPTQVQIDVYDLNEKELLESHVDKKIKQVEPFATSDVSADSPTKLGEGEYWAKIRIYSGNEIILKDKVIFAVKPPDPATGGRPSGPWPWIMLGGLLLLGLLAVLALVGFKFWRLFAWLFRLLARPFIIAIRIGKKYYLLGKAAFWRWLHRKSSQYQITSDTKPGRPKPPSDESKDNDEPGLGR